jgi:hypothetical protein
MYHVGDGLAFSSGTTEPRWVLVVTDDRGKEHYLNVTSDVWDAYENGDLITPEEPLTETP